MACGEDAFIARCCVGRIDLDTVDRMAKALVASILRNRATKVKRKGAASQAGRALERQTKNGKQDARDAAHSPLDEEGS